MQAIRGGDIQQLLVDGKEYAVQAEATLNYAVGGKANTIALNGNGTAHGTQKRKPGGFTDCPVSTDDSEGDLEALQAISDAGEPVPVSLTLASGVTYQGNLSMATEDEVLTKNAQDGTTTIAMLGTSFDKV